MADPVDQQVTFTVDARTEAQNIIKKELSNLSDNSSEYRFFLTLADICLILAKDVASRDKKDEVNSE